MDEKYQRLGKFEFFAGTASLPWGDTPEILAQYYKKQNMSEGMKCKYCRSLYKPQDETCPHCGAPLGE